jgi:hypothetical protein
MPTVVELDLTWSLPGSTGQSIALKLCSFKTDAWARAYDSQFSASGMTRVEPWFSPQAQTIRSWRPRCGIAAVHWSAWAVFSGLVNLLMLFGDLYAAGLRPCSDQPEHADAGGIIGFRGRRLRLLARPRFHPRPRRGRWRLCWTSITP